MFVGVESGNPEILMREKKVTREQVLDVVTMIKRSGIQVHCSFIFGLDGETEETMKQTIAYALELRPTSASFSIAVPYPGTHLFDVYSSKGYIKTCDWGQYGGETPVFETEALTKEKLTRYLVQAHRRFYFRPSYVLERLRTVRSMRQFWQYASVAFHMVFDVLSYKR